MNYLKLIAAVVVTILMAVTAALTDSNITNVEWINVSIAGVGAAAVFAAPNVPGAMYTKSILAALSAVLVALTSFITDGISTAEGLQIIVIFLGALGIYTVPNKTTEMGAARPQF